MNAWSYSSLTAFETCPKRYYLTRVAKTAHEEQTEATIWGNKVHKALENRINTGCEMPEGMEQWASIADRIRTPKQGGMPFAEKKLAITKHFTPTTWMAKDCWCRGIVDAGVLRPHRIMALDWKTGKRKHVSHQMMLCAGLLFAHYPEPEIIATGFVWLQDKKLDVEKFLRSHVPDIWGEFLPRVQRLEQAYESNVWIARPSGLCKQYCPVGRKLCSHCGKP